jgi:ribosomal protein L18
MYDSVDVGSKDWRKEIVWRFKMGAPCVPVRRVPVSISGSFKQILLSSYRRVLAFLTETSSDSESSVNHSKQASASFLTGARIGTRVLEAGMFFAVFLTHVGIRVANSSLNSSSQSPA